jgi:guanylate kinase
MLLSKNKLPYLLLVGESGSGKSAIANELSKQHKLKQLASYTTRKRRSPDENGHIFIEQYESIDWLKRQYPDRVAETIFNGDFYFATQDQVKKSDIYIIDKAGIDYFKSHYSGKRPYVIVYVKSPCFLRQSRMKDRGDTPEEIAKRIEHDIGAFKDIEFVADHTVRNYTLSDAVEEVWNYLNDYTKAGDDD